MELTVAIFTILGNLALVVSVILLIREVRENGRLTRATNAQALVELVSPFLLEEIQQVTGGVSVGVNLDIARGNIDLAAKISQQWTERAAVRAVP